MKQLIEKVKERNISKYENIFFDLIKKSQDECLTDTLKEKFLKSCSKSVAYLEEEFLSVRENGSNNRLDFIAINNGLTLIEDIKIGINITENNLIKENIDQLAAHYQGIKDYQSVYVDYASNGKTSKQFFKTIDVFTEVKNLSTGYQKEKALNLN